MKSRARCIRSVPSCSRRLIFSKVFLPEKSRVANTAERGRTVMKQDSQTITAWVWEWLGMVDESQRIRDGDWLKEE